MFSTSKMMTTAGAFEKRSFVDLFDRADNTNIGGDWTEHNTAGNGLDITSNELRCFGSGSSGWARWNTPCFTDDMYSEVITGSINNGNVVVGVRMANDDGWPAVDAYLAPNGNWFIRTRANDSVGTSTTRNSGFTFVALTSSESIRLEAQGNLYTLKRNGSTLGTWSDSGGILTPSSLQRSVGTGLSRESGSATVASWAGGDL